MHHSLLKRIPALLLVLALLLSASCLFSACAGEKTPAETTDGGTESGAGTTEEITTEESTSETDAPAVSGKKYALKLPIPSATLENFPVLIRLDRALVEEFDALDPALTVTDHKRNVLAYERVDDAAGTDTVEFWVLLPEYSAKETTTVTFATGGTGSAGNVWEEGYGLVLHMSAPDEGDSSPFGHAVNAFGTVTPSDGTSPLGSGALKFDGASYLTLENVLPLLPEAEASRVNNEYTNTGYVKPTDWNYAQGLTTDGEYLYFAGHFDKIGKGASIHKIRMSDMQEVDVFNHVAPMHGADMDYHKERGTLFVSSGGNNSAWVYEIDPDTGEVLNRWDMHTVGYGIGAAVTLLGGLDVLVTTGTNDGAKISFAHIRLEEGGNYTVTDVWHYDETDLGVPQGIETLSHHTDGTFTLYYLADAGASVSADPHYLYAIELTPAEPVRIKARYHISIKEETEGISFYTREDGKTDVYFGSNAERIYKLNAPLEELKETPLDGPTSPNAFTLSCFVKVTRTDNQYPGILGFGSATNNKNRFSLHLFGDTAGKLRFGTCLDDVWTKLDTDGGALTVGEYHHVAAVYDGHTMKLYIDGSLVGTKSVSGLLTDYGAPFSIGVDIESGLPAFFFTGEIDEIRLVGAVRDADWIAAEAAQGTK